MEVHARKDKAEVSVKTMKTHKEVFVFFSIYESMGSECYMLYSRLFNLLSEKLG